MKFSEFSIFVEKIEKTASRLAITEMLARLFGALRENEIEKSVYLLQGRVTPLYEHIELGMAEKMVIKSSIRALFVEKKTFEDGYKRLGDLGKTVEYFKQGVQTFDQKELTVLEVYSELYRLAVTSGPGSQEFKMNILAGLMRQLDPLSCRYLVRIPQGTMRLGFSDMTILDSLSWMVKGDKSLRKTLEQAYHVRPDLGYIARLIKEKGEGGLQKSRPHVNTPIIMMRAERLSSAHEIIDTIGQCAIEPKYDGFRLQVHLVHNGDNHEVRLFSRSLEDVSYMYPDIVAGVKKEVKGNSIIFEGEAIGVDPHTGKILPFQETVQRKRKYAIEEKTKEIPLKLFCFDLLFYDEKSYLSVPYKERRRQLERVIDNREEKKSDIISIAPVTIVFDERSIDALFDRAVAEGLEGIIAKKLNGIYQPGARGWNWIKFKRSYSSKIHDTIDCLVMGYDLGKGKRTGFGIGAFLVGVFDDKTEQFVTVAKIGTGLTDEEWKELKTQSSKLKVRSKPERYNIDKAMACDVWVEPQIIVEIRADEITKSPVHTAGLALRFPRLERFRRDKGPGDVTTLREVERMS